VSVGSTKAGGATAFNLGMCDLSAGVVLLTQGITGIQVLQNEIVPMSLSYVVNTPGAGTHTYGLCGGTTSANWNAQAVGIMTAIAY
jgi:hypothetical protein